MPIFVCLERKKGLLQMKIAELHSLSPAQVQQMLGLMKELNDQLPVSGDMVEAVAASAFSHLFVALSDDRIVGTATLCVFVSPTGTKGKVEDVVVTKSWRGQGIGRQLVEFAIGYAREHYAPLELALTSNPKREAANRLYQAIGFQFYDTNVYKIELPGEGPGSLD